MYIESEEHLRKLYGFPKGRSKAKELSNLEYHSKNFIQHSPFLTISSRGKTGSVDCSPRGGAPGFVKMLDDHSFVIPDGKGNNRLDSLINIIETGDIGCLFLIPGVDETLRVNGKARISQTESHLKLFSGEQNPPKVCIEVTVEEVFLHCAKALMRSKLWSSESKIARSEFPTMAAMINDQLLITDPPESQEEMVARYKKDL